MIKRLKKIIIIVIAISFVVIVACNVWVVLSTAGRIFHESQNLPDHRMALVLGTSHRLAGGAPNPFFQKRIETAAALYKIGKIDHFILSGDNRSIYYNEPQEMKKALINKGVPSSAITLDYAGLRTLDSIVRCKEIFGQEKITIITQSFHSYRALFISNYYEIDAVAMVAEEPGFENSFKVRLREYFARIKAVMDLYILKTSPKYMGEKENVKL